jgi:hypothetical protein
VSYCLIFLSEAVLTSWDVLLALAQDDWGPIAFATYWRTLRYLRPSGDSSDAGPERQLLSRRLAQRRS